MATLTGKLIHGLALEPHCRFLFIPWVKSNGVMRCLKVRNFGSSIPVKYIPKNSPKPRIPLLSTQHKNDSEGQDNHNCLESLDSNVIRSETSYGKEVINRRFAPKKSQTENARSLVTPVNDFQKISRQGSSELDLLGLELMDGGKITGRRYGVGETLDRNYRPINNLNFIAKTEVEELGDFKSMEDTEELVQEIKGNEVGEKLALHSSKSNQDAEDMAVGFLSRRALTTAELRKKLIAKRYPPHVVDEVVANFQIRKFLDDLQYAEAFSRSRFSSLSWGPGRIKQALRQKGVSETDAEKAIKLVFKDGESGEDHQSEIGLSKSSLDRLFAQASKRWLQGQSQPVDKRKSKIIQWLRYRGFNWGVVNVVLKKLQFEFPP